MATAAAEDTEGPQGRLTRQGRIDPRLSLAFDDMFTSKLNRAGALKTLEPFISHTKGNLYDRQKLAVNVGLWCLAERRCDCGGVNCGCGSSVRFDSCVYASSAVCTDPSCLCVLLTSARLL